MKSQLSRCASRNLASRGVLSKLSAVRAAVLSCGDASGVPSSAKLTKPLSKVASQSAERRRPL